MVTAGNIPAVRLRWRKQIERHIALKALIRGWLGGHLITPRHDAAGQLKRKVKAARPGGLISSIYEIINNY